LGIFPRKDVAAAKSAKLRIDFRQVGEIALPPVYQRPYCVPLISFRLSSFISVRRRNLGTHRLPILLWEAIVFMRI
jgi:hypothetical protein